MKAIRLLGTLILGMAPVTGINASAQNDADGIAAGHEYVNLGLRSGTYWATCNLGASAAEEAGDYYAWGDTIPGKVFNWKDYRYYLRELNNMPEPYALTNIGEDICGTEYDAASRQWGHGWRMPSEEQLKELKLQCAIKPEELNGIKGVRVTGPSEKSIFIPFGGNSKWDDTVAGFGSEGGYWSGISCPMKDTDEPPLLPNIHAKSELFVDLMAYGMETDKAAGLMIRPVISREDATAGIGEIPADSPDIRIYLSNGSVIIEGLRGTADVTMLDISGRIAAKGTAEAGKYPIPALSMGTYLVSVSQNGKTVKTIKINL